MHESSETHPYGSQIFRFADDQGPSDDDLNLILSAPDLLEALESWIAYHDDGEDGIDSMLRYAKAIDMTRAAISRAKGEE